MFEAKKYSAEKLRKIADFVTDEGGSVAQVLHGTGLDPAKLAAGEERIALPQLVRGYRNANRMAGDAPWGVQIGKRLGLTDYGFYGYALICSPTLRKALDFSIKYHQLAAPTVIMSLRPRIEDGLCALQVEDTLHEPEIYRFNIELQIGLIFSLLRDILGQSFRFDRATVRFEKPPHFQALQAVMECTVECSSERNALYFDADLLDRPLRRANLATWNATRDACDKLLQGATSDTPIAQTVYVSLLRDTRQFATGGDVATALNLSERNLRRRLGEEGTSFRAIKGEVLSRLAIEFISNTEMTADEVAERLGFSDASNFCKTFKKWTGQTTSEFRASRAIDPSITQRVQQ